MHKCKRKSPRFSCGWLKAWLKILPDCNELLVLILKKINCLKLNSFFSFFFRCFELQFLPEILPNTKTEQVTPKPKAKLIESTLVESFGLSALEKLYWAHDPRPNKSNRDVPKISAKNSRTILFLIRTRRLNLLWKMLVIWIKSF